MRFLVFLLLLTLIDIGSLSQVRADHSIESRASVQQNGTFPSQELQRLVGPIALYPDELLSLVLPAATYPLQIVQASRLLKSSDNDQSIVPEESWHPSVVGLLNYPEVLELMNADLDWTWQLGTAVANQNDDVLEAIQAFRQRARAAGNLKSDRRKRISEEDQAIVIGSSDPETIYVPDYDPEIVVVRQSHPVIYEYSDPYPVYYYSSAYYPTYWASYFVSYGFDWAHNRLHRYYHHRRHVGKRPFKTQIWKARHRRVGRPGKRRLRNARVRRNLRHKSGDKGRPSFNKNRRGSRLGKADGRPRLKKMLRVAKRGNRKRRQGNVYRRAFGEDVRKLRHQKSRVDKKGSQAKFRTVSKRKRRKTVPSVSSQRKGRAFRKHRIRVAHINRQRSANRNKQLRSSAARRRTHLKRGHVSTGRRRISRGNFRGRARMFRSARGGNRGRRGQRRRR